MDQAIEEESSPRVENENDTPSMQVQTPLLPSASTPVLMSDPSNTIQHSSTDGDDVEGSDDAQELPFVSKDYQPLSLEDSRAQDFQLPIAVDSNPDLQALLSESYYSPNIYKAAESMLFRHILASWLRASLIPYAVNSLIDSFIIRYGYYRAKQDGKKVLQ